MAEFINGNGTEALDEANKLKAFAQRLDDFVTYWLGEGIEIPNMILELDLARQTLVLDEMVRREEADDGPARAA